MVGHIIGSIAGHRHGGMWLPGAHATLPVIAAALAASAAIELAYTLFTPGPDEALCGGPAPAGRESCP
jgi:hypothetical protein